ncbi:30S ribosomal protein S20 [Candidatus Saccharibacteria bacterium]|nr:30S ribosomal protein S20 [Candidatus Saccharibacteria bacterium]
MPIIKSAKKRVKLAAKANARNTRTRRSLREAIKAFNKALESGKSAEILKLQTEATSAIDTAAKKNVIHKSKAARFKSRMAIQAKSKGIKPVKPASRQSSIVSQKPKTKKTPAKPRAKS